MKKSSTSWLTRLKEKLVTKSTAFASKKELLGLLLELKNKKLFDSEEFHMLKGVLNVSDMQARDIMIPRSQMVVVNIDSSLKEAISIITKSGHSRFPVVAQSRDEVIGLMLAKDLLQYAFQQSREQPFKVQEVLRPGLFIPESKRLNVLLREFRLGHHHMAIIVDEYGSVAGLITIEDVLEQIVGEIEDEYDVDEESYIQKLYENSYTVKGLTPIEVFNKYFKVQLNADEFDTIAGLVTQKFEHVPKKGETVEIDKFQFKVLHANNRKIILLSVQKSDEK